MSITSLKSARWPAWLLLIGLLGIGNFIVSCWSLSPPKEGTTIYFWLIKFYDFSYFLTPIILVASLIVVGQWFSRLADKSSVRVVSLVISVIVLVLCLIPSFGWYVFVATLRVVGQIEQNDRVYYLVKYYDDRAIDYAFCKTDKIGFAGQCTYIAWQSGNNSPEIYIDQTTDAITIKSKNPSFIWMNTNPPICINDTVLSNDAEYPGGCTP